MQWAPSKTTVRNGILVILKEVVEDNDARGHVYKAAKRRRIQDRDCFNEQIVDWNTSVDHVLPSLSRKIMCRRRIGSELITMLMDRTSDIPNISNITEHFRDVINILEEERTHKTHGERRENEQGEAGETNGSAKITNEHILGSRQEPRTAKKTLHEKPVENQQVDRRRYLLQTFRKPHLVKSLHRDPQSTNNKEHHNRRQKNPSSTQSSHYHRQSQSIFAEIRNIYSHHPRSHHFHFKEKITVSIITKKHRSNTNKASTSKVTKYTLQKCRTTIFSTIATTTLAIPFTKENNTTNNVVKYTMCPHTTPIAAYSTANECYKIHTSR